MINLQTTKSYLSRDEMRMINGGRMAAGGGCLDWKSCTSNSDCDDTSCSRCVEAAGGTGEKACGA